MGRGSKGGVKCCEGSTSSSSSSESSSESSSSQDRINCNNCLNNTAPSHLKVSISGILILCCNNVNGDWVLPFTGIFSNTCRWQHVETCLISQIGQTLTITAAINAAFELTVTVAISNVRTIQWNTSLGSSYNCINIDVSVPFSFQSGIAGLCTSDTSPVQVSAV